MLFMRVLWFLQRNYMLHSSQTSVMPIRDGREGTARERKREAQPPGNVVS